MVTIMSPRRTHPAPYTQDKGLAPLRGARQGSSSPLSLPQALSLVRRPLDAQPLRGPSLYSPRRAWPRSRPVEHERGGRACPVPFRGAAYGRSLACYSALAAQWLEECRKWGHTSRPISEAGSPTQTLTSKSDGCCVRSEPG
jgi:hypothetical protein